MLLRYAQAQVGLTLLYLQTWPVLPSLLEWSCDLKCTARWHREPPPQPMSHRAWTRTGKKKNRCTPWSFISLAGMGLWFCVEDVKIRSCANRYFCGSTCKRRALAKCRYHAHTRIHSTRNLFSSWFFLSKYFQVYFTGLEIIILIIIRNNLYLYLGHTLKDHTPHFIPY